MTERHEVDVAVIGGGQAGLATAFYLRRAGLAPGQDVVVLDAGTAPGGAWSHMWDGLQLFSPSAYSSRPGWMMPASPGGETGQDRSGYPPREHVVDCLTRYEERYDLQVRRPHRVAAVRRAADSEAKDGGRLLLEGSGSTYAARVVVSAWCTGFRPDLRHLAPLGLRTNHGRIRTIGAAGTRAADERGLFLVGYGDWTGPASATLIGVGRSARDTAAEIVERIAGHRARVATQ